MHSKWQIWDYFSSASKGSLIEFNGILFLSTFDPTCLKLVKDRLLESVTRPVHHKIASEVTLNWIEEEFLTLNLFGGVDCYFIHQAQELRPEVLELLNKLKLDDRFIVLSYEVENVAFKKSIKDSEVTSLIIESPRFWETSKLLDFVCLQLKVPLSLETKEWMIDSLENDLSTFLNSAQMIKINFPNEKEISLSQVKTLFNPDKLDQFALASLYSKKKFGHFFEKVLTMEGEFEKIRGLFSFMQSHLVKMCDTSYLSQKPRLNLYDKEIQTSSKIWKSSDLVREIDRFNQWEIECKKKNSLIWSRLKDARLRLMR